MKNSLITLGMTIVLIGMAMPGSAEAADKAEQVAFTYNPQHTASESYTRLQRQARQACGKNYYSKANRKCVNAYLQEILPKIGSRKLTLLHNDRMSKGLSMRRYAVKTDSLLAQDTGAVQPGS